MQFVAPVAKSYTIQVGTPRTTTDRRVHPGYLGSAHQDFHAAGPLLERLAHCLGAEYRSDRRGFLHWDQKQLINYQPH